MSTLRTILDYALPEILPPRTEKPLKGTEVIRELRRAFPEARRYKDATMRYHLSILAQDPSTPITSHNGSQGYHLRPESERSLNRDSIDRLRDIEMLARTLVATLLDSKLAALLEIDRQAEDLNAILNPRDDAEKKTA